MDTLSPINRAAPIKIAAARLFVCFLFTVGGCNLSTEPPPKPAVVTKKVEFSTGSTLSKEKTDVRSNFLETLQQPESKLKESDAAENEEVLMEESPRKTEAHQLPEDQFPPLYEPKDKIDPFASPFLALLKNFGEKKVKKRTPQTPLEKLDYSQIKLTAIIEAPDGNKALVEEVSGKGYVISKGTYIGLNSGRVIDILQDRVLIEEELENVLGEMTLRKVELKLQKPIGEF